MENRFGFKDLINAVLLVAVLVMIALAMLQFDRQHDTLESIDNRLRDQGEQLTRLNDKLKQGVALSSTGGPTLAAAPLPQTRVLAAKDMPGYATGDWFVDVFSQTVGKLTPLLDADVYQSTIESYVLEALIVRDPKTLDWKPWLAKAWDVSEDGLTIGFDLREDVVFADGEPFTSADVVFTLDMIRNPEINAPRLIPYYEVVDSVRAEGPYRVVFELNEPYFLSLSVTGGTAILAKHYYEQFTPEEFNSSTGLLFGSGPYKLSVDPEDWQPGSGQIELVRNGNYWGPKPTFDRLLWKEISEEEAQLVSFRNGEIDRYSIRPERYKQLKKDKDLQATSKLHEYVAISGGYRYVGWNQQREGKPTPFANKQVRRAMTMLLNRQEMAEQLQVGLATVATGPFNPLSPQSDPDVKPIKYDPQAAKALLKEAGYEDRDGDGVVEGPDGKPFRFTFIYPASNTNYQLMAQYLKDGYARAGITMSLEPTEWNTMIQRITDRNFDAITLGWGGTVESDPKQIFHSGSIANGGNNYVGYRNPEVDKLIDEARLIVDIDERTNKWRKVHRMLQEDQPYTFLFNFKSVVMLDKRFHNVQIVKTGLSDREEYFVPAPQQRWTE